NNQQNY
nr:Chain A, Eukaryotic peptide chain release factor GTP-binding subunit [synthetic construct]5K2E_A Chain A, Eukaryotic peptide chain release factor GTP-binding subunit [Saccharomyces cerevisiae]5K2F_A Chain A, Eukaryotic peptide chain release factor GTP-binding subunit [Saccharomyces cerevisiae]